MVGYIKEFIVKYLVIMSVLGVCAALYYAYTRAYTSASIYATDKIYEDATVETVEDYIIVNNKQAEKNIDELNTCLNDIPIYIKSFLIDKGWKIEYVDYLGESTKEYGEARTVGRTNTYDKTIQIDITRAGKQVLYHELGHILDIYGRLDAKLEALGIYEDSDEWNNIQFQSDFWQEYIDSAYNERKSEVYYTFVFYPDQLKEQAPNIYQAYTDAYNSLHSSNMTITSIELYMATVRGCMNNLF